MVTVPIFQLSPFFPGRVEKRYSYGPFGAPRFHAPGVAPAVSTPL